MGYNKIIVSGDSVEVYEYEKNIHDFIKPRAPRSRKSRNDGEVLSLGGQNPFQGRELGKRRDNAKRSRMAFARLVRANLDRNDPPILFTLTYAENETDLAKGYRDFSSFVQALRYRFQKAFRYVCVPEFQKRGAVHFHALVWGLPSALVLSERDTRFFANLWGKGFIFLKTTDGDEKLAFYLAKYMTKAYLDPRLKNQKAYVASRNVKRPVLHANIAPIWPIMDDLGLSTSVPLHEKNYMTQWLGKGRYRVYQKNNSQSK